MYRCVQHEFTLSSIVAMVIVAMVIVAMVIVAMVIKGLNL